MLQATQEQADSLSTRMTAMGERLERLEAALVDNHRQHARDAAAAQQQQMGTSGILHEYPFPGGFPRSLVLCC